MLSNALPAAVSWVIWMLAGAALVDAGRRARWIAPRSEYWRWALATAAVLLARQWTVTMPGGVSLQYIGTAWLTLLLGYPRAVVSIAAVMLAEASLGTRALAAFGVETLLFAVAPAWLMWALTIGCRRWLPRNPFVFLIGVGFLGLFAAYALPLLAAAALGTLALGFTTAATEPAAVHALSQYTRIALPYALLLATGEAWLEGMLTTVLVVYAPGSVRLFDEAHYLARR